MKKMKLLFLVLFITLANGFAQQRTLAGQVLDEQSKPMAYANVFIKGTAEGATTDTLGYFSFTTARKGDIILCVHMLGYAEFCRTISGNTLAPMLVKMNPDNVALDNVVVAAGNFRLKGNSQWGGISAVDMVTTAGSTGDLYRSLQTLPGAQIVGESGKLYVRGGDNSESQTYIDEMHVLSPYTNPGDNVPVRGRYSPFMFEGINFSTGGYSSEYGQGLSSVLPLSTKDISPITKIGVNPSSVGLGGGGTKAFSNGSMSVSLDYQNLGPYRAVFPDRLDWINPYQLFAGSSQIRFNPDPNTVYKTFIGYDRTTFTQQMTSPVDQTIRDFDMKEDNLYLNSTFQRKTESGYKIFAGGAFSLLNQQIGDAAVAGDTYNNKEWEVHLKTKATKRFSNLLRLNVGVENFFRHNQTAYADSSVIHRASINHFISALFATANLNLTANLSAELSSRVEYMSIDNSWNYNPRVALTYNLNGIHFSGILGRYTQLPDNKYLLLNQKLLPENCIHTIGGIYYEKGDKVYRVETYYKKYNDLALQEPTVLNSEGYGYSKGVDLFFNDRSLFKNLEYMMSYSLNLSKRKYQQYTELTTPQYATVHNATLALKYTIPALKTIWGITDRFASGRPYHDPAKDGIMNSTAPFYNSVDMSLTYLVSKKVIVYASATNLLGRKNIYDYNYTNSASGYRITPVTASSDHFFYLGIFITLSGKTAYDVSNF